MNRGTWRRLAVERDLGLCGLSVLVALVPLVLIGFYVVSQGISSLNYAFFTNIPHRQARRAAEWPTPLSAR